MEKSYRQSKFVLLLVIVVVCCLLPLSAHATKKLLASGAEFHVLYPADLQSNWTELQKLPFSGYLFALDSSTYNYSQVNTTNAWSAASLTSQIDALQACTSTKVTDNFLIAWTCAPSGRIGWTSANNTQWNDFANNLGVMASVALQGNIRGLFIDQEDYPNYLPPDGISQFYYDANQDGANLTACKAYVRGVGQSVMQQIGNSCSGSSLTLLFTELMSHELNPMYNHYNFGTAFDQNDLWPSFVNGMLDGLRYWPANCGNISLIDGDEPGYGWWANPQVDHRWYDLTYSVTCGLVDSIDSTVWANQVKFGVGQDLECYFPSSPSYMYPPANLKSDYNNALIKSDQYVWAYGEYDGHWAHMDYSNPPLTNSSATWEFAKDANNPTANHWLQWPNSALFEDLITQNSLAQIGTNSSFASNLNGWTKTGSFTWDGTHGYAGVGSAKASGQGTTNNLKQIYAVTAGHWYIVKGRCYPYVCSDPTNHAPYIRIESPANTQVDRLNFPADDGMWESKATAVLIPAGATQLVVKLYPNQNNVSDTCYFDDCAVYQLN